MTKSFITAFLVLFTTIAFAQKDTSRKQSIDITSSYKPVLRNAVKINFAGTQLTSDTTRPVLRYNIPSQNLFYAYTPVSLKPLALLQDTSLYLGGTNFVKAGFGNYATPYISAGIAFGDGKTSLMMLTGDYIQSKGKLINQDYSLLNIKAAGSYFTDRNEIYGGAEVNSDLYNLYGYDHNRYNYSKKDVRQELRNIAVDAGFKNTAINNVGINYDFHAKAGLFTNTDRASETNILLDAAADKTVNKDLVFKVLLTADLTGYTTKGMIPNNINVSNNLIYATPSVNYNMDNIKIHGGVTPVWNNDHFDVLPDIYAEAAVPGKEFSVQAGWIGRFVKNNYKNLTDINPYLAPLFSQVNTKETEYYGGLKASVAKHLNVSAKAGLLRYHDLPFFINDTATDNKSFTISNERNVTNFRVHGDVSYINQDKFTLTGGLTINGYTGMKSNAKAWHTLPLEIRSSLRWQAYKTVLVKADYYGFGGSNYLIKGPASRNLSGGNDLSAGAEVKINKRFSAWADVNNILNDKYERWHNYPVYGTNFIAGIIARF